MIKVILLTAVLLVAMVLYLKFRALMLTPLEKFRIAHDIYTPVDIVIATLIVIGAIIALLVEAVIFIVTVF